MINQDSLNSPLYSSNISLILQDSPIQPLPCHSILHPESLSNSNIQSHNLKHSNISSKNKKQNQNNDLSSAKAERQLLLEKRKLYADSLRSKNKTQINPKNSIIINKSTTINNKNTLILNKNSSIINKSSSSINNNLAFDFQISSPSKKDTQKLSQLQKQYYTTSKYIDSNVFRQINQNNTNRNQISKGSQNLQQKSKGSQNPNYFQEERKKFINQKFHQNSQNQFSKTDMKLHSYRETYSHRKQNKNKQNNLNCSTNRKNSLRNTSYAQIFDKKNTMSVLLTHQKGKNIVEDKKIVNQKKKQNFQMSLILSSNTNSNFNFQDCKLLEEYQCDINGFTIEDLTNKLQNFKDKNENLTNKSEKLLKNQQINTNQVFISGQNKSKLSFQSRIIEEKIDFSKIYEEDKKSQQKQILVLVKQNSTFKRELSSFRKQNSQLKKQIDNYKKQIKQLQQKTSFLLEKQKQTILDTLKKSQNQNHTIHSNDIVFKDNECRMIEKVKGQKEVSKLQEMFRQNQKQTYLLKNYNQTLELKVFMLQKRLAQEEDSNRKKIALQLSTWRDKYNKLKNQHLKYKNNLLNKPTWGINSDSSFSLDISRDESVDKNKNKIN